MARTCDLTMSKLRILTGAQLALLFNNGRAGVIPRGDSIGKAIFAPGTIFGAVLSFLGNLLWRGKIIDADGRGLINKILGCRLIRANVFRGASWSDGKESIVIDYKATSLVAFFIRDEIRCVAPGLFLGRVHPYASQIPLLRSLVRTGVQALKHVLTWKETSL